MANRLRQGYSIALMNNLLILWILILSIMGQVIRAANYDRAANERNAISSLTFLNRPMMWHRLDDGVMGGRSETALLSSSSSEHGSSSDELHFKGQINTEGGGFCSIRSPVVDGLPPNLFAIRMRYIGDGKTYKVLLSDGTKSSFGPSRRSPSWQVDLPTMKGVEQTSTILLDSFIPSLQGGSVETEMTLDPCKVKQIGFMLSLKLSNGRSNPTETFGQGIFPFSLKVRSIDAICSDKMA